jgi:hypothetical protein
MTEFPKARSNHAAQVRSPEDCEAWGQFVVIHRLVICRMARRRGMRDADAQNFVPLSHG